MFSAVYMHFKKLSRNTKIALFDLAVIAVIIAGIFISLKIPVNYIYSPAALKAFIPWISLAVLMNLVCFLIFGHILFRLPGDALISGLVFSVWNLILIVSISFVVGLGIAHSRGADSSGQLLMNSLPYYFSLFIFCYYASICLISSIRYYKENRTFPKNTLIVFILTSLILICACYAEEYAGIEEHLKYILLISAPPVLFYILLFKGRAARFMSYIHIIDVSAAAIAFSPENCFWKMYHASLNHYIVRNTISRSADLSESFWIRLVVASVIVVGLLRILEYLTHPFFLRILPEDKILKEQVPEDKKEEV